MRFVIGFNTIEEEGDKVTEFLQTNLLSASNIEVTKSERGVLVSHSSKPVLSSSNIIDVEVLPKKEEVIMIGSNIDEVAK